MRFCFLFSFFSALSFHVFSQTADVTEGCAPLTVHFDAPSSSTTYYWNFQDGSSSDIKSPKNVFGKPGTYQVSFQESVNGPVVKTIAIRVFNEPQLKIAATSGCAPLNAQFTNTTVLDPGIQVKSYTWVFGDGQVADNVQNPLHYYITPKSYDVSLTLDAVNPSCTRTVIFTNAIEVLASPTALFVTDPASGTSCDENATFAFKNQSTGIKDLTYSWSFGNSKVSTAATPPSQSYASGQYTASLTVSYAEGVNCTSKYTRNISVGTPKPDIKVKSDTLCLNDLITFKSSVPGFHSWHFGTDGKADYTNRDSAHVFFQTPGKKTVTLDLTSFDGRCSGTVSKDIYLQDLSVKITSDPTFSCSNPTSVKLKAVSNATDLSYFWILDHTDTFYTAEPVMKMSTFTDKIYYDRNILEQFDVFLSVVSKSSQCKATSFTTDSLWLPNAIFSPQLTTFGCAPLSMLFTDSSTSAPKNPIVKWTWLMGDGKVIENTTKASVSYVYQNPGIYNARLVVTTKLGCTDTSFAVTVKVGNDLSQRIDFQVDKTEICINGTVNFTSVIPTDLIDKISAYHFDTEGNRMSQCFNEKSASWTYKREVGSQDVSLSVDYNGCISTRTKKSLILVKGAVAEISYDYVCSKPLDYSFKSTSKNGQVLTWDFGDGTTSTLASIDHQYKASRDYTVSLKAEDPASGCPATFDNALAQPRQIKAAIKLDTSICIHDAYTFRADSSKDVNGQCHTGYTWQFPGIDKRPFTSNNPTGVFSFEEDGWHKTRLIVQDVNGCKDTAIANFKVYKMNLKITSSDVDNKICVPAVVKFTNLSSGDTSITHWFWNFGDQLTSTLKEPTHNYLTAPPKKLLPYKLKLIAIDQLGCLDSLVLPISYYAPVSNIVANPTPNLCLGKPVTLTAADYTASGSSLSYKWNFGNGKRDSLQTETITFDSAKTYKVSLRFTENGSNCFGDTSLLIRIQDYPVAAFTTSADAMAALCAPQNITFNDASVSNYPLTYSWNFGNGQLSSSKNYTLSYAKGNYVVSNIVKTSYGCADTATRLFKVYRPGGNFTMDKNLICKSESINFTISDTSDVGSFTWFFGDGYSKEGTNPVSHQYNFHPPSGSTIAKLVVTGLNGICPVPIEKEVKIRQVIAAFDRNNGGDTSICFNDGPYPLTDKSVNMNNYLWNFGDGSTSTISNPGQHVYATSGIYNVTLSGSDNVAGCKDTITKAVVIYKNPVLSAVGDTVCQGNLVHLHVLSPDSLSTYLWSPSKGLTSTSSFNPIADLQHSQIYQLVQTDTNGCTDKKMLGAIVIEPPSMHDWDTTIIIGDSARLPVFGQAEYLYKWTPEYALSCLQCNYPWARPLVDTTYLLKVSDRKNCFVSNYEYMIKVRPETFVKLPTTFTPNDDHHNDSLFVEGWGIKKLLEFQVFNRWGQKIYESSDLKQGWDGKFSGVPQNQDVYVYKVKVLTWREEILYNEGYVNLVH